MIVHAIEDEGGLVIQNPQGQPYPKWLAEIRKITAGIKGNVDEEQLKEAYFEERVRAESIA